MASGLRQNFGTMTMALHAGLTARDAVHAALLAEKGFLSDGEALDGKYGFFNLFVGVPPKSLPLGRPFELVESGIIFKPYPSGAPTHAAVHAAIALQDRLGGRLHEVPAIVCHVHPWDFRPWTEMRRRDDRPDNGRFPAGVEVGLAAGRSDSVRCAIPPGAPAMPMSGAEADRKYRRCAAIVLDAPVIERTRAMILGIDRLADVGELCVALEGGGRP